jgi:hypothetical protein
MAKKDHAWMLLPQEDTGTYQFNGQFKVSNTVNHFLNTRLILHFYNEAKREVLKKGGAAQVFVFERVIKGKKERILLIDELNREMIKSGKHGFRDNFCRMIFDYEYHKMD